MQPDLVSRVIRGDLIGAAAYTVPDASGMIKLDAMENPFPLPEPILRHWQQRVAEVGLNRYPDSEAHELQARLRDVMEIDSKYKILLGNGSDELILLLIMAVAKPGATVMAPAPGFVMYRRLSEAAQQRFVDLPLNSDFDLDAAELESVIVREQPSLLFMASPNNPSGNHLDTESMRAAIAACPGLVVIDEAYFAFTDRHHVQWLEEFDNLLIMRTLSKLGLAGLRLGFLWGKPDWICQLNKLRLPYNVNNLTQAAAAVALQHFDLLKEQVAEIRRERDLLMQALAGLTWLDVYDSEANFILVRVRGRAASEVHQSLRARNILVKRVDGSHPRLANCLRITVGSAQENVSLLQALAALTS